jgi:hypothetical protein
MATDGLEISASDGRVILVFAPSGELHELPLLTANYLFRKENIPTVYLGVNITFETLRFYLDQKPVDYVFTHVITHFNDEELDDYLCQLCNAYPKIKFLVSGPASSCIKKSPTNLAVLHTIDDMLNFARELAKTT